MSTGEGCASALVRLLRKTNSFKGHSPSILFNTTLVQPWAPLASCFGCHLEFLVLILCINSLGREASCYVWWGVCVYTLRSWSSRGCSPANNNNDSRTNPWPAISLSKPKHSIYRKKGIITERSWRTRGGRSWETTEGCELDVAHWTRTDIPLLQSEVCGELGLPGQWPLFAEASKEFLVTLLIPGENNVKKAGCSSTIY